MPDSRHVHDALFFTSMPNLKDLCCLTIGVPVSVKNNDNVNAFQPQVIKCREIIFTEPDVLASPLLGASKKVQIIMNTEMYQSGKLQARLQKMNITSDQPKSVTAAEFQLCLQYTLKARLAPLWNKIGSYLVQGREFVTSLQKMNAVSLDATVNKSELYLRLSAVLVRCPPLSVSDLDVCAPVVDEFLNSQPSSSNMIEEYSIGNKWCYILPSMKRGQIVNILREVPSDCPFNSYKSMKKYWKNMYGYRLPETEDDLLYYQIYFKPIGNSLFTYPECCVRLRELTTFNCPDTSVVLQEFLADFQTKMPSICGQKVLIQSKAKYPVAGLNVISSQVDTTNMTNLSEKNPANIKSQYKVEGNYKYGKLSTPWKPLSSQIQSSERSSILCSQKRASLQLQKDPSYSDNINRASVSQYFSEQHHTSDRDVGSPPAADEEPNTSTRIIPMFNSKYSKPIVSGTVKPFTNEPRNVPVFGKIQKNHGFNKGDEKIHEEMDTAAQHEKDYCVCIKTSEASIPHFVQKTQFSHSVDHHHTGKNRQIPAVNLNFKRKEALNTSSVHYTPVHSSHNMGTSSAGHSVQPLNETPGKLKRKAEVTNVEAKKARVKPKVQEGVDVKHMAQTNQLEKLNAQTLLMWLKSKGVPCKAKDKKAVLVEKLLAVIQIADAEQ